MEENVLSIENLSPCDVSEYAVKELRYFIEKYSAYKVAYSSKLCREIRLSVDKELDEFSSKIEGSSENERKIVTVSGGSPESLLNGVYRLLDKMGVMFGINGESVKGELDISAADEKNEIFKPFCRYRGIRQHINFPMDISSYPLEEAKEYIRNMARIGMNAVTFHSYNGQWHSYKSDDGEVLAGNFFYGNRHQVPDFEPIKKVVRNRESYCIPEAEEIINDSRQRSGFAMKWLGQLIDTAKEAGLRVTLSVEIPDKPTHVLVGMVRSILDTYPRIDVLEWITDENPKGGVSGALKCIKRAINLYKKKDEIFENRREIPVQIGVYVTDKFTLKICRLFMKMAVPRNVNFTFLPAHGAKAVRDNIKYMRLSSSDLQRTMLYSWAEFDGNMYILQNSCEGIGELAELCGETSGNKPINGICLNHWRTAENALCIAYAARAMDKPLSPGEFYLDYAHRSGIKSTRLFAEAMEDLGRLDIHNRDKLFNIGFCYLGCWLNPKGLGWIRNWKDKDIDFAINSYESVGEKLRLCLKEWDNGADSAKDMLSLLINRCDCSVLHLKAIGELKKICKFAKDSAPEKLSDEGKNKVSAYCDSALRYCHKYIENHAECNADRGCEGTIISYYATVPVYIDHIRQYFVFGEKECKHRQTSFDAPPPPNNSYLK